jgi:hypothetical protein
VRPFRTTQAYIYLNLQSVAKLAKKPLSNACIYLPPLLPQQPAKAPMIAMTSLGKYGRLGNQLFQYAFIRTLAQQLNTTFYCPTWEGDQIFRLCDESIRERLPPNGAMTHAAEPINNPGYWNLCPRQDNTDFVGYFQSPKYFDSNQVKKWYLFNEKTVQAAEDYTKLLPTPRIGIHIRFGDFRYIPDFYVPKPSYYKKALQLLAPDLPIVVFSDDLDLAQKHLSSLKQRKIAYAPKAPPYVDLYAMSMCTHFICSNSTLSWWGAFLRHEATGITICPAEGISRPGTPWKNTEIFPKDWIRINAGLKAYEHYFYRKLFLRYRLNILKLTAPIRQAFRKAPKE